jgi:hypothetical protein
MAAATPLARAQPAGTEGETPASKSPPLAVAMLTWPLVSPEVATKIDAQKKLGGPVRVARQEWQSGNALRIVEAIGQAQ